MSSNSKATFDTVFYDSNTGHEPIVLPGITVRNYRNISDQYYSDYYGNPHELRNSSYACNGDVADARAFIAKPFIDSNNNEYLYYVGRSDGGNSLYRCSPHDYNKTINIIGYDGYTQTYNMGSQGITFIAKMDIHNGNALYGEFQLTRENGNGKGNSLNTHGIYVDKNGLIYLAQSGSCCIPNRANLTVNNVPVGNYAGGDGLLQIITNDMKNRLYWTPFSSTNNGGSSSSIDIASNDDIIALLLESKGNMITKNPISGTKYDPNGNIGYVAVFPVIKP